MTDVLITYNEDPARDTPDMLVTTPDDLERQLEHLVINCGVDPATIQVWTRSEIRVERTGFRIVGKL